VRLVLIAVGIIVAVFGLATMLNFRGLAVWGSQDQNRWRDSSGKVIQRQPVWVTRIIGGVALAMGIYMVVRAVL
jgi:uncharacterized membrane protein